MPDQPITYLDTFAKSSDFDSNGRFVDRYYPNMVALMEQSHAERVWYAPVIYSLRTPFDLKRFIDHAQQSSNHFLVMEQWLIGIDYLRALWLSFALPRRIVAIPEFCGADVSFMIRAEVAVDSFSTGLFGAILRYRFLDRLRRAGVEIEKVIDWSENQVVDRALCLATRDFYPGVKVIGYQGFIVSEHYLSHEPACYERDAGTIPDVICVVNKALLERKKKYCTEQRVAMAPAFRFKQLMNYHPVENREKDSILLALPVQVAIGRMIIHLALQMKQDSTFQFLVKLHPSVSRSAFLSEVPDANDSRFEFIENSLYDLFPSVALLISSDSSACFEAVSCGIRVVVIGNITGSTSNPLAGIISSDYWRVCYDSDCLMKVWSKRNQPFEIDSDASLMPVTRENVAGFLKL